MKRKKYIVFGVLLFCFIVGTSFVTFRSNTKISKVDPQTHVVSSVSVTLDTGEKISTISGIQADNAFTALKSAAKQQNLALKTKQYDFGVFVEQIGTIANMKEKSWIYFVNGKSGTIAADKQSLKAGDSVQWKYMTPAF